MVTKSPVKSVEVLRYAKLTLGELEKLLNDVMRRESNLESRHQARILRVAIQDRKKLIKQRVMSLEETNDRFLIVYDSTDGYLKMAGKSVLFFSLKVAERIRRRCNVVADNDHYSRSEEGIISLRGLEGLRQQLELLDIKLDAEMSTPEIHVFRLPRVYKEAEIERLYSYSQQELQKIQEIILPNATLPILYRDILEVNRLIYHGCRGMTDTFARETFGRRMVLQADMVLQCYLNYSSQAQKMSLARQEVFEKMTIVLRQAEANTSDLLAQNILSLWLNVRQLKFRFANSENLRLLQHRQISRILTLLVDIEKMVESEYRRLSAGYGQSAVAAK